MPASQLTMEAEQELLQFLKVARPDWSKPKRRGRTDLAKVHAKLLAIGVTSPEALLKLVDERMLNKVLADAGFIPLTENALEGIRKRRNFLTALEFADVPQVRQLGVHSPVRQLLSQKLLAARPRHSLNFSPPPSRPGTCPSCPTSFSSASAAADFSSSLRRTTSAGDLIHVKPRLRGVRPGRRSLAALGASVGASEQNQENHCADEIAEQDVKDSRRKAWRVRSNTADSLNSGASLQMHEQSTGATDGTDHVEHTHYRKGKGAETDIDRPLEYEEVERIYTAGVDMAHTSSRAKWSCRTVKTLLVQGEEMLQEQRTIIEQTRLLKDIGKQGLFTLAPRSPYPDPFRTYVTSNISQRLQKEAKREMSVSLSMAQSFDNIRKNLTSLGHARKELAGLRAQVSSLVEEPASHKEPLDLHGLTMVFKDLEGKPVDTT